MNGSQIKNVLYMKTPIVKKRAKQLKIQVQQELNPITLRTSEGKFNWGIIEKLSDMFGVIIHVWSERRMKYYDDDRDWTLDNPPPVLNLLRMNTGRFCLIKNIAQFQGSFSCPNCRQCFTLKNNLLRHKNSQACMFLKWRKKFPDELEEQFWNTPLGDYMVDHVFVGGKVKPRKTYTERIEYEGLHVTDNFELKSGWAFSDIETFLSSFPYKHEDGEEKVIMREGRILYMNCHRPVCVSVISNLDGNYSKVRCFTSFDGSSDFISTYCDYLYEMADFQRTCVMEKHKVLLDSIDSLKQLKFDLGMFGDASRIGKLRKDLEGDAGRLVVFFFNSTFDLNCMLRYGLAYYLYLLDDRERPTALKNSNDYISMSSRKVIFLDILKFTAHKVSLPAFLRSYDIEDKYSKISFPYEILKSPKDLFQQLPIPYESFYSKLRQENTLAGPFEAFVDLVQRQIDETCDQDAFDKAVEWALNVMKRKTIPETGREVYTKFVQLCKDKNMTKLYHYLAMYCNVDCVGSMLAIKKMRDSFMELTGLDMLNFVTLPSMAFSWAVREIAKYEDECANFLVFLGKEAHAMISSAKRGGATAMCNRLSIAGYTKIRAHCYPPDETKTVQGQLYLDANGLYGSTCKLDCPVLGNYTLRRKSENFEYANVQEKDLLTLAWLQYQSKIVHKKPVRTKLYYHGEKALLLPNGQRAFLDGWINVEKDERDQWKGISLEYHDFSHGHPFWFSKREFETGINPISRKPNKEVYHNTLARDKMLRDHEMIIEHVVIWSHQWRDQIQKDPFIQDFVRHYINSMAPDAVEIKMSWERCLQLILESKLHGFVECCLTTPDEKLKSMSRFPPFWLHRTLSRDDLCSTELRYANKHFLLTSPADTLANELNVENSVITTDLLKFYVEELGLKCTDITRLCQFRQGKPLENFLDKCLHYRNEGRKNNNSIQKLVGKLWPNSFYGSSLLRLGDRRTVRYIPNKNLRQYLNKANYSVGTFAGPSSNSALFHEIEMNKHRIMEKSPIQLGSWILNTTKSILLRFIYNVLDYFLDEKCWEINALDTDGLIISIAGPDLKSICKPEKLAEFDDRYANIFVVRDEDAHTPFLFKTEKESKIFIGLAPKEYCMYGIDDPFPKLATKGITKTTRENAKLVSLLNFFTCLFDIDDNPMEAVIRGIRCNRNKDMCTFMQPKAGLSRFCAKQGYFDCAICDYPRQWKDDEEMIERFYPYKDHICSDISAAWDHIKSLSVQHPEMALRLPETREFESFIHEQVVKQQEKTRTRKRDE